MALDIRTITFPFSSSLFLIIIGSMALTIMGNNITTNTSTITTNTTNNGTTSPTAIPKKLPATCLSWMWTKPRNVTNTATGSPSSSASPTPVTTKDFTRLPVAFTRADGCDVVNAVLDMNITVYVSSFSDRDCADRCAQRVALESADQSPPLFAKYDGLCICINRTLYDNRNRRFSLDCCEVPAGFPQPSYCLPNENETVMNSRLDFLKVSTLDSECPVVLEACEDVDGCGLVDDATSHNDTCCFPGVYRPSSNSPGDDEEDSELTHYYQAIIRWCLITVVILAVMELVLYVALRRMRENQPLPPAPRPLRDEETTEQLSEQLLVNLAKVSSPARQPSTDGFSGEGAEEDGACPICLDDLASKPCVGLPCGHTLHADCTKSFLSHQLRRYKDMVCPMCRASIADSPDGPSANAENNNNTAIGGNSTPPRRSPSGSRRTNPRRGGSRRVVEDVNGDGEVGVEMTPVEGSRLLPPPSGSPAVNSVEDVPEEEN